MDDADIRAFGEALARFRTRTGLSQQRLAILLANAKEVLDKSERDC